MKYKPIKPGTVFGNLTVIEHLYLFDDLGTRRHYSRCRCTCGKTVVVLNTSLRSGNSQSCGCSRVKEIKARCTTHGDGNRKNRLYRIWSAMRERCYRRNAQNYPAYGGRGITVCNEWKNDFLPFKTWALSHGYTGGLSIDRINPNGNYEPTNCRWVSAKRQQQNKRNNKRITVNGESLCVSEWADRLGVSASSLYQFAHRGGNLKDRIKELDSERC